MNRIVLLALLAGAQILHAQGTLQFSARMTSPFSDDTAHGSFTLQGNMFTYDVAAPYGLVITQIFLERIQLM